MHHAACALPHVPCQASAAAQAGAWHSILQQSVHLPAATAHLRSMCLMLSVLMTVVMPSRLACNSSRKQQRLA